MSAGGVNPLDTMVRTASSSGSPIDKTFPFDRTLEALAYVEQGRATGKVVISLD